MKVFGKKYNIRGCRTMSIILRRELNNQVGNKFSQRIESLGSKKLVTQSWRKL